MRQKLTAAFVANVEPTARHEIYWDTEQSGFGLLVLPSGKRRFLMQYRAGGRSRRLTFKPGLSLVGARREARAKFGDVARGNDPLNERRREEGEAANTLKAIVKLGRTPRFSRRSVRERNDRRENRLSGPLDM